MGVYRSVPLNLKMDVYVGLVMCLWNVLGTRVVEEVRQTFVLTDSIPMSSTSSKNVLKELKTDSKLSCGMECKIDGTCQQALYNPISKVCTMRFLNVLRPNISAPGEWVRVVTCSTCQT